MFAADGWEEASPAGGTVVRNRWDWGLKIGRKRVFQAKGDLAASTG